MIVLDEEDHQHLKPFESSGPTIRLPERAAGRSSSTALPDYETSQALHDSTWIAKPTPRRRRLDSTFWKAVLIALVIYMIISLAIGLPFIILKTSNKHSPPPSPPLSRLTQVNWDDFDLDQERNTLFSFDDDLLCNAWDKHSDHPGFFTASREFFLEDRGILVIRSNATGSNMYGNITFATNPDKDQTKPILVFKAYSHQVHLRRGVSVCYNPTTDERGFDIFVPPLASPKELSLDIQILFPHVSHTPPSLQRIATSMPLFVQRVKDLSSSLSFQDVSLQGVQSTIIVDDMVAETIAIKSSSAGISGRFNVSLALTLDTIGGPIDADVTLFHGSSSGPPQVLLTMETGNSDLNTNIVLQSTNQKKKPPTFIADLRTFNAPLNVNLTHHPDTPSSMVHLQAETTGAPSNITVDSKFTGCFDAQSKLSRTYVLQEKPSKNATITSPDPDGQNRPRTYHYDRVSRERTTGWVGWGKEPSPDARDNFGSLEVISLLDTATLRFVQAL